MNRTISVFVVAVCACLVTVPNARAADDYVDENVGTAGAGTSWSVA